MAKVKEQVDIPFQEGTITVLYYSDEVDGYGFDLIHDGMEFIFGHGEEAEKFAYHAFRTVCELIKQRPAELLDALDKLTAITPDDLAQLELIKDHQPIEVEEDKHMIKLDSWGFSFTVPFEILEEITVGVFNQTVSEFVEEYTRDNAKLVYQLLQDDEVEVAVELNKVLDMKFDEVYANQEFQITLHYDHLDLVCEASYENQTILTKQELREYAISQFLQYEDFGNINFLELEVTVKLTKLTLVKATEFSL